MSQSGQTTGSVRATGGLFILSHTRTKIPGDHPCHLRLSSKPTTNPADEASERSKNSAQPITYMILPNPPHHGPRHHHSHGSHSSTTAGIAYGGSIEAVPAATPAAATPKKSNRMQDESPP